MEGPRVFAADNAGPFTLDGTRTFIVGSSAVAILDPGPDAQPHLDRLVRAVATADTGTILLTHLHADHSAGAATLSGRTGFPIAGPGRSLGQEVKPGDRIETDAGALEAIPTPGHSRDHLAYLLHRDRSLFVGDLVLGKGTTTWVGGYGGCVADYLASLDRIEALEPSRLLPAHGPPLESPREAIRAFREHRLKRIGQVERALSELGMSGFVTDPSRVEQLVDRLLIAVYPSDLPAPAREGAKWSLHAVLEYLEVAPFPEEPSPDD